MKKKKTLCCLCYIFFSLLLSSCFSSNVESNDSKTSHNEADDIGNYVSMIYLNIEFANYNDLMVGIEKENKKMNYLIFDVDFYSSNVKRFFKCGFKDIDNSENSYVALDPCYPWISLEYNNRLSVLYYFSRNAFSNLEDLHFDRPNNDYYEKNPSVAALRRGHHEVFGAFGTHYILFNSQNEPVCYFITNDPRSISYFQSKIVKEINNDVGY